ncbi:dihydrodipicolinate synthase family protein [Roseomonas sp. F4]
MTLPYTRATAKAYARQNMRGIWAAAMTPFRPDLSIDEAGFRANLRHWFRDLGIDGVFVAGKQGEFYALSLAERKRLCDIAVEEAKSASAQVIFSASDQNMDVVIDLARHAEAAGADYVVVHAPVLHFVHDPAETLLAYYSRISEASGIGIALWSHPDSGYLMQPALCAQLAREVPNVVAIKYSVPRAMYAELTKLAGDTLIVSTASEEEWLDNVLQLGWQLYLCSAPPFLLQTAVDRRMRDYTDAAFAGRAAEAKRISASLDPVRAALKATRPPGKPHAQQKAWMECLGQAGGPVRRPMLELTVAEREAVQRAFAASGLQLPAKAAE